MWNSPYSKRQWDMHMWPPFQVRRGRLRLTLNFYQLARWMAFCEAGVGSTIATQKEFIFKKCNVAKQRDVKSSLFVLIGKELL